MHAPALCRGRVGRAVVLMREMFEQLPVAKLVSVGEYHAIAASACKQGSWNPSPSAVPHGIVYVPCAVNITGSGTIAATITAERAVTISGSAVVVAPPRRSDSAVVTAATGNALDIKGSGVDLRGALIALSGKATLSGAGTRLRCGVVASELALSGASLIVQVDDDCE
jgi:hypothetical protein